MIMFKTFYSQSVSEQMQQRYGTFGLAFSDEKVMYAHLLFTVHQRH